MKRIARILLSLALALLLIPVASATASATQEQLNSSNNKDRHNYSGYSNFGNGAFYYMHYWASPIMSHLETDGNGFIRVEYIDNAALVVEHYDKALNFISRKDIALPLPFYGGVYISDDSNFVVCGQMNNEEDDEKEVIRIIRYNKDWQEIGHASLFGANTTSPFRAGSLRFARSGDILFIRTAHEMYTSSDGRNHQANLTMRVRISDMKLLDSMHEVWNNSVGYVSHSFNQFIHVDGDRLVAADHGDGYPRGSVVFRYIDGATQAEFSYKANNVKTFSAVGEIGENRTGMSVGGFEYSSTHYLIAGNSIEQNLEELGKDDTQSAQRNIYVTATSKEDFTEAGTTLRFVTNYQESDNVVCSTPYLVKINSDSFLLLWTEGENLRYCFLNGTGAVVSEIYKAKGSLSDCVPIVTNNHIMWYVTKNSGPIFYKIDLSNPSAVSEIPPCKGSANNLNTASHVFVDNVCEFCGVGRCGENAMWLLDNNGVLTVMGSGDMYDYGGWNNDSPWEGADIKEVVIKDGVTSIGSSAFYDCSSLTSMTIPNSVTSIGDSAFSGCSSLTNVTIPDSVTSIGNSAFYNCSSLTSVTIPDGVTSIGSSAFEGCSSLTSVTIPDSVTSIGSYTFYYCSSLKSITIPDSVTSIGYRAFSGCWSIENVYYGGNQSAWGALSDTPQATFVHYSCQEPNGHWTSKTVEGSCTKDAYTVDICPCGYEDNSQIITAATGHKWVDSTCTAPKTCSVCKVTEGAAKGHSYADGKCSVCGTVDPNYKEPEKPAEPTAPSTSGVNRLAGSTRYETAFQAANELKELLGVGKFRNVVVASGENFPDALAGTYLAAMKDAPMLLVKSSTVNAVKDYIRTNLIPGGTIYLLGDREVVSKKMESGLDGFNIKRLGGKTRYDTNLLILNEAGIGNKDIVVCTGKDFADSLSASALGRPILLVKDNLNDAQKDFLARADGNIYIIGGTKAVSTKIENQLKAYGTVRRVSGSNRYDTSVQVAKTFFDTPFAAVITYGENFPDGLSGGPVAYTAKSPLLLTRSGKESAAAKYIADTKISSGYIMGDKTVVSEKTVNKVFGK